MEQPTHQMINLYSLVLVLALMLAGVVGHWVKKKARKEINGSLFDYLFLDNKVNSGVTGGSIMLAAMTASATGAADVIDPRLLWQMVTQTASIPAISLFALGAALQSGWQLDSMLNKGATR